MPSKDNCLPATSCLIKKGEPTQEEWEEILTCAIDVFSADFEETTLPTLRSLIDKGALIFVWHKKLIEERGLTFLPTAGNNDKQGFFRSIGLSFEKWKHRSVIGWGILRDKRVVIIQLVITSKGQFWYFPSDVTISGLFVLQEPRKFLWSLRQDALSRVEDLERKLLFARGRAEYLESSMAIVNVATAPPSES